MGGGGATGCVFFFGAGLLSPLPRDGVTALPLGFPAELELDLDAGEGVLRGMSESIAQMVCFSSSLILMGLNNVLGRLQIKINFSCNRLHSAR